MEVYYRKEEWIKAVTVALSITASSAIYVIVCYILRSTSAEFAEYGFAGFEADYSWLAKILWVIGILTVTGSIIIQKWNLKKSRSEELDPNSVSRRYLSRMLLGMQVAEAIGIFGLVLCLLSGDFENLLLMNAVALAVKIYHLPRKEFFIY